MVYRQYKMRAYVLTHANCLRKIKYSNSKSRFPNMYRHLLTESFIIQLTTREHLITPLFSGVHICVLNISELLMFK